MRKQYTEEERAQLVELVTSTGTTIAAAADRLGVHRTTASNWMRRTRRQTAVNKPVLAKPAVAAPRFARLVGSEILSAVEVWVGGAVIRVKPGFDAALLHAVVEALRGGTA
jgi:transposase-like protein